MAGTSVRTRHTPTPHTFRWAALVGRTALLSTVLLVGAIVFPGGASAASGTVGLGTVGAYSVLGGQTVTNTGPTVLSRDLGVSPGTAITGFPPGTTAGATHAADAAAAQAQLDLTTAYNDAAGRAPTANVAGDLVGRTLVPGVYKSTGPLGLTGRVTLDGKGDPNAVFIFQIASTLITGSASMVDAVNGAQACHVFWQVASSATLGTGSTFQGTIMALTSISVTTGTTVKGRALARNGQVSLDTDVFTSPDCAVAPASATATATATPTTSASPTATSTRHPRTATATVSAGSTGSGSGSSTTSELPHTGGTSSGLLLGVGSMLLVSGALLVTTARTRRVRKH
jgi:LPXTG-motif cell wall-anchored protein